MRKTNFIIIMVIVILFMCPLNLKATGGEEDFDFTDAIGQEKGTGWTWDNDTRVLTLSGAEIDKGIILPENSSIKVEKNSVNSIVTTDSIPITTNGKLKIEGKGTLTIENTVTDKKAGFDTISGVTNLIIEDVSINTNGLTGLSAQNISIKNSTVDISGYKYGIYANSQNKDKKATVELINCTGKITGQLLQGIEIINQNDVELSIQNCYDLIISGNTTNKRLSGTFERSGVRLYTLGSKSNAIVSIKESEGIYFYGTNTGIAIDCHANDSSVLEDNGKASLLIENSMVVAETITNTWAAFFVNNNGMGKDAIADITIKDSNVSALAPNDVAIMTSTKKADSCVTINNSILQLAGIYAGIRAKSNTSTDAEIFVIENSLIVVVNKISANYKTLDEMDNAISADGSSGIDENSKVIKPKDCEITMKSDGNWEIPDEGTILINGEEKSFVYGGVIKQNREVLPYITSLNNIEFTNLNDALRVAENGDNVILLTTEGTEEAILPLNVTLTSPTHITIKTNEDGYKVIEEIVDEKYIYSVVPVDKFKMTYHSNYGEDKTIIKEVFEQSNVELDSCSFMEQEGKEFDYWVIGDDKYYPGDMYYKITGDIDIYAQWKIKEEQKDSEEIENIEIKGENPETFDDIEITILIAMISLFGAIVTSIYLQKTKNK